VFNIVGAIASNAITFILPPLFYFSLIAKKNKTKKFNYYVAIAVVTFFVPFGILSVITKFLTTFGVIKD
jgi:amino acid permease